jgi:hypothetical protein
MVHFGLKMIDEHGARCLEVLKDSARSSLAIEESVDHMRSQWISFSVKKQEARVMGGMCHTDCYVQKLCSLACILFWVAYKKSAIVAARAVEKEKQEHHASSVFTGESSSAGAKIARSPGG